MDFSWLASARQNLLWYCSTNPKCHEDKATHNEITIKLGLAEDAQMIQNNAGKQFFTCKHNMKTLGKIISISQSTIFQFLKEL